MNMQELKELIYQGEKVDIECKKAEKSVPKSAYESYSVIIPELSEPPVRTLGATIPENESHIFR